VWAGVGDDVNDGDLAMNWNARRNTRAWWPAVMAGLVATATVAVVPVAAQFGGKATRPQVETPKGPVRQVILKNCSSCHGIDDYAYNALDRAGWNAFIDSKHKGMDVAISAGDRALLLDWVAAKFGTDTKPFPRAYVPPEITTFFSDAEAQALVTRACTTCHAVDRVNEARFSPDRWRVVTVDMRERGAKITDEELERLVEWLGRVKGTNPNQ
jgi:mono/diheme cytochrome c family protein